MITVKYIGGRQMTDFTQVWGGTVATIYCMFKAFENDPEYLIEPRMRIKCYELDDVKQWLDGDNIKHIDDTFVLSRMFEAGFPPPDVVGPIARSPIKQYTDGNLPPYTPDWFYRAKVMRLNDGEEYMNPEYLAKVNYITHGIDLDLLQPSYKPKRYVLWAGDVKRAVKNYPMWVTITNITQLPPEFEFKTMIDYRLCDYWDTLDETAILVNTSKSESFGNVIFEARAKGVATIHRTELNGRRWRNAELQVEYTPEAFRDAILDMLSQNKYLEYGQKNRRYVEKNNTLKQMRDSYASIYRQIIMRKERP